MNCLTDIEIELFALRKDNVQGVLVQYSKHMETCSFCLGRYRDTYQFYHDAGIFIRKLHSDKEMALVKSLERIPVQHTHIALPFYTQASLKPDPVSVMAAANILSPETRVTENLGILATKEKDILIRVMKSSLRGEIDLHLISENEQKYRNVLVRLPFLPDEFTSDENGKVNLGNIELPELSEMKVEVQTPIAAFDLSAINFKKERIESQVEVVLTNENNDSIKCEFIVSELNYTLKVHLIKFRDVNETKLRVMVSHGKQAPNLVPAQKGIAVFQGLESEGGIRIQVFD